MPALIIVGAILGLAALAIFNKMQADASASGTDSSGGFLVSITDEFSVLVNAAPAASSNDPLAIALPLIEKWETFSPTAYEDPPGSGKYSIGWGHSITGLDPYTKTSTIGRSEADDLLRIDAASAWQCVYQNVKVSCSPQQFAALISFTYNEGCAALKSSTLLSKLNADDSEGAAAEFANWNKEHVSGVLVVSADLTARRADEEALFQTGDSVV